jgi:hypothetical protein
VSSLVALLNISGKKLTAYELLSLTDKALYSAKEKDRNHIINTNVTVVAVKKRLNLCLTGTQLRWIYSVITVLISQQTRINRYF